MTVETETVASSLSHLMRTPKTTSHGSAAIGSTRVDGLNQPAGVMAMDVEVSVNIVVVVFRDT